MTAHMVKETSRFSEARTNNTCNHYNGNSMLGMHGGVQCLHFGIWNIRKIKLFGNGVYYLTCVSIFSILVYDKENQKTRGMEKLQSYALNTPKMFGFTRPFFG